MGCSKAQVRPSGSWTYVDPKADKYWGVNRNGQKQAGKTRNCGRREEDKISVVHPNARSKACSTAWGAGRPDRGAGAWETAAPGAKATAMPTPAAGARGAVSVACGQ